MQTSLRVKTTGGVRFRLFFVCEEKRAFKARSLNSFFLLLKPYNQYNLFQIRWMQTTNQEDSMSQGAGAVAGMVNTKNKPEQPKQSGRVGHQQQHSHPDSPYPLTGYQPLRTSSRTINRNPSSSQNAGAVADVPGMVNTENKPQEQLNQSGQSDHQPQQSRASSRTASRTQSFAQFLHVPQQHHQHKPKNVPPAAGFNSPHFQGQQAQAAVSFPTKTSPNSPTDQTSFGSPINTGQQQAIRRVSTISLVDEKKPVSKTSKKTIPCCGI